MRYTGERLRALLNGNGALRAQVYESLNSDGRRKGVEYYYGNGINITIKKLTDIMAATRKPIEFFVDFEEGEHCVDGQVSGTGNVVNSTIVSNEKDIAHLREVMKLKDDIISEKERIILMKDNHIDMLNKRYDELIGIVKSDNLGTK